MKPPAADDPHELVGIALPEDSVREMSECVVEEYLLMGWNDRQLMGLFTRPFFRMTHQIYRSRGEDYVRAVIERVRAKWTPSRT